LANLASACEGEQNF